MKREVSTKKMYDNELPEWAANMVREKGLEIQPKALYMLVDHIGNDLQRMENEIEKLIKNPNLLKKIQKFNYIFNILNCCTILLSFEVILMI